MKILLFLYICLLSFVYAIDCKHQIFVSDVNITWTESTQNIHMPVRIRRRNNSPDCRYWYVGISTGNAGNYNRKLIQSIAYQLDYNIYKNTTTNIPIKRYQDQTNLNEEVYYVYLASKNTIIDFYVRLPYPNNGQTFFKKGDYLDNLFIEAVPVSANANTITESFNVSTFVPPEIDLSLVDSGGGFDEFDTSQTLDFAALQTGDNENFDLRVQSNAGYIISFSSLNNGKMKHATDNYLIDYVLKINGVAKDLSSSSTTPLEVANSSGITPIGGDLFDVDVTIGNIDNKLEGQYSDFITITTMSID